MAIQQLKMQGSTSITPSAQNAGGAQKNQSVDQQNQDASVFNKAKADEQKKEEKGKANGVGGEVGKIAVANEGPTAAGEVGNAQGTGAIEGGNGNVSVNSQNGKGTEVASNDNSGQKEAYKQGFADAMAKGGNKKFEGLC